MRGQTCSGVETPSPAFVTLDTRNCDLNHGSCGEVMGNFNQAVGSPMPSDSSIQARLANLREEMDSIHLANGLYWKQGECHSREEMAEYERRQERLEEIRKELSELTEG